MGGEHRPLRVPRAVLDEHVELTTYPATGPLEAVDDGGGEGDVGQATEPERFSLAEEGTGSIGEDGVEQGRLRAGEDVRRLLAMVLDMAADDRFGALTAMIAWNSSKTTTQRRPRRVVTWVGQVEGGVEGGKGSTVERSAKRVEISAPPRLNPS